MTFWRRGGGAPGHVTEKYCSVTEKYAMLRISTAVLRRSTAVLRRSSQCYGEVVMLRKNTRLVQGK